MSYVCHCNSACASRLIAYWSMWESSVTLQECVRVCMCVEHGSGNGNRSGLLGAVFTSNVPCGLLDGALRHERWIFCITRLQGLFQFLGCREGGGKDKKSLKMQYTGSILAAHSNSECAWASAAL